MAETKGIDKSTTERSIAVLLELALKYHEDKKSKDKNHCSGICVCHLDLDFTENETNIFEEYTKKFLTVNGGKYYPYKWDNYDIDSRIDWLKEHIKLNS